MLTLKRFLTGRGSINQITLLDNLVTILNKSLRLIVNAILPYSLPTAKLKSQTRTPNLVVKAIKIIGVVADSILFFLPYFYPLELQNKKRQFKETA